MSQVSALAAISLLQAGPLPAREGPGAAGHRGAHAARRRGKGARLSADGSLGERARGGDSAAFEALFQALRPDVVRLCRRMLGAGASAEDATQEVFLRARRGFGGYDPKRPFRRWLLAIAGHHCVDQLRRRSREARLFDPSDLEAGDLSDPGPTPLREALDAEASRRLLEAIDDLPDKYRLPLLLRYFQELDYAAIADALGVTVTQVGTLLFRARRRLRERLAGGNRP